MIRQAILRLTAWLAILAPCYAADWADHLPEEWLGVVVVERPIDLIQRLPLLAGGAIKWLPDVEALLAPIESLGIEDRPLVVGLAGAADRYEAFALIPAESYDTFCDAVDADAADQEAFAVVAGYELRLAPAGSHTWATLSGATLRPKPGLGPKATEQPGDVVVYLSNRGLEELASVAASRRQGRIAKNKPPAYSFDDTKAWIASAAELAPLVEEVAAFSDAASVSIAVADDRAVQLELQLHGKAASSSPPSDTPSPADEPPAVTLNQIEMARLDSVGVVPDAIARLLVASIECRADVVGAREYHANGIRLLGAAVSDFLDRLDAATVVWGVPAAGQPLTANRHVAFRCAADPLPPLARLVDVWNTLVTATPCETPLRVERSPIGGQPGMRLTTDIVAALGEDLAEPILPMLETVFGPVGRLVEEVTPSDGVWRITPAATPPLATAPPESTSEGWWFSGSIRLDRWIAWQRSIADTFAGDILGKKPAPPFPACPPVRLDANSPPDSDTVTVRVRLPATTVQAITDRLTSTNDSSND